LYKVLQLTAHLFLNIGFSDILMCIKLYKVLINFAVFDVIMLIIMMMTMTMIILIGCWWWVVSYKFVRSEGENRFVSQVFTNCRKLCRQNCLRSTFTQRSENM